jgi:ubiquitin-large subunit ribosomal protein L40e
MQIFIHLPKNEIITLDVSNADATIYELKKEIYKRDGTPVNMQRLIFGGKELVDDSLSINQYTITKECVILMLIKNDGRRPHSLLNLINNILFCIDYVISKFYS